MGAGSNLLSPCDECEKLYRKLHKMSEDRLEDLKRTARLMKAMASVEIIKERYEARGAMVEVFRAALPMLTTTTTRGRQAMTMVREALFQLTKLEARGAGGPKPEDPEPESEGGKDKPKKPTILL